MTEKVIDQLKGIIADELDVNLKREDIDESVSLFEEGIGLDSVTIMEFISLIESHFALTFSDEELNMEFFKTLETVASSISTHLKSETAL